jgi:predicted nucleotidyltransferase
VAAFVFGSMASGNATSGSDIDLMVIGSLGYEELVVQLHPLQTTLGREINPKLFALNEWQELVRNQSAFVRDVLGKPRLFVIGADPDLGNIRKRA